MPTVVVAAVAVPRVRLERRGDDGAAAGTRVRSGMRGHVAAGTRVRSGMRGHDTTTTHPVVMK